MKCTNRRRSDIKKRNRWLILLSVTFICLLAVFSYQLTQLEDPELDPLVTSLDERYKSRSLEKKTALYASSLCVTPGNVGNDSLQEYGDYMAGGAGLFDVENGTVCYASQMFQTIYPASTTKILTALVAVKHGDLDEMVTISPTASSDSFSYDEQVCGLLEGQQLTLRDLLFGLLLHSGNDAAVAIAEHIGGSVEGFAAMMNEEALQLMATKSHFVNPNGLHNPEHYTTVYDLYLIFNEFIKYPDLIDIISTEDYIADVTDAVGNPIQIEWIPTNYYQRGLVPLPEKLQIVGGKTGTTNEAGNCLILLEEGPENNRFISIVMGAPSKDYLYECMTALIESAY